MTVINWAGVEMELLSGRDLVVKPIPGVAQELVDIGLKYWAVVGIDRFGAILWGTPIQQVDTGGRGSAHIVAAAAVRATLTNETCYSCHKELRLTSRNSLIYAMANMTVPCVLCTPQLSSRIAAVLANEKIRIQQRRQQSIASASSDTDGQSKSTNAVEFSGRSSSEVMLKAAQYLAELEKQGQVSVLSMHWATSVEHEVKCRLRIRLDNVAVNQC